MKIKEKLDDLLYGRKCPVKYCKGRLSKRTFSPKTDICNICGYKEAVIRC